MIAIPAILANPIPKLLYAKLIHGGFNECQHCAVISGFVHPATCKPPFAVQLSKDAANVKVIFGIASLGIKPPNKEAIVTTAMADFHACNRPYQCFASSHVALISVN